MSGACTWTSDGRNPSTLASVPCWTFTWWNCKLTQGAAGSRSGISRLTSRGSLQRRYGCKGDAMVAEPNSLQQDCRLAVPQVSSGHGKQAMVPRQTGPSQFRCAGQDRMEVHPHDCKPTTCPQVLETCPSFSSLGPLLRLHRGHASCPPTRDFPPSSPCPPPSAQRF